MGTASLRWELWLVTLVLAVLVLPLGALVRLIPAPLEPWEQPAKRITVGEKFEVTERAETVILARKIKRK